MDRSQLIKLVDLTYQTDEIGQQIPIESCRMLFCDVSSVSQSEISEAGRSGISPEYRATVYCREYHGEQIAEVNGVRYGIYRTYIARGEMIELYLERKAGV